MNRKAIQSLPLFFLCLCLLIAAASCMSKEAKQAISNAEEDNTTRALIFCSGSSEGKRTAMPEVFPMVADLASKDSNARFAMLARFSSAICDDDLELCIYAYAFEQLGDKSVIPALRRFISRSFGDRFLYAPHFAAHAILSLTGELDPEHDINWYDPQDLKSIAEGGGLAASSSGMKPESVEPSAAGNTGKLKSDSCKRKYVFVDENNKPILDNEGKAVTLCGMVIACPKLVVYDDVKNETDVKFWNQFIKDGGGSRVSFKGWDVIDGKFGNTPTWQFNCGGYASRKINDNNTWVVNPDGLLSAITRAKVVERIDNETWIGSKAKGDMIFYFTKEGELAGHVAEVYAPGTVYDTVWNADEVSGLFEASATAKYFTNSWFFGEVFSGKKLYVRKTYRWKPGQPRVIPYTDTAWLQNKENCDVTPVTDGKCPELTSTTTSIQWQPQGRIYMGAMGLYVVRADDGFAQLISGPQGVNGVGLSPDGSKLAAGFIISSDTPGSDTRLAIYDTSNYSVLRTLFTVRPTDTSATQFTNPTWLPDSDICVVSDVGDLRLYKYSEDKFSVKIGTGGRASASTTDNALLIESSGFVGIKDVLQSSYSGIPDIWDVDDVWSRTEDPARVFTVTGSEIDWIRPKWCGDRVVFIKWARGGTPPDSVHVIQLSADYTTILAHDTLAAPGSPVRAAAFSPDGSAIVVAIGDTAEGKGGLWAFPRSDPTKAKRILKSNLADIPFIDLAWGN